LEENAQQRRLVYYHGDVQGVGFRYTTRNAARAFQVTGFVQNLADGRVHLACEGDCQELDAFLADIARRMAGHITHQETSQEAASGEYDRFEIRE
jgi:acylphosphatase